MRELLRQYAIAIPLASSSAPSAPVRRRCLRSSTSDSITRRMDACLLPSIADIRTPPGYDRQKSARAPATKENAERSAATTPTDFVMAD